MGLSILDGTGAKQTLSTTTDGSGNLVNSHTVADPTSGVKQGVGTHHNNDSQVASGDNSALVAAVEMLWNGASFDRRRANIDLSSSLVTLSGTTSGTYNSADQTNFNHKGIQLGINLTSISGGSITVTIQGKDAVSGVYYTILQSAALSSAAFTRLTVHPGLTTSANAMANDLLPRTWRVQVVVGSGATVTGTIGASLSSN